MKKILVVLLVLAVAGGVFAQEDKGEWSISGSALIGTYVDFLGHTPVYTNPDGSEGGGKKAMVVGAGYFQPYQYYGAINGLFRIDYKKAGANPYLVFDTFSDFFYGGVSYSGNNFRFVVESNLWAITNALTNGTINAAGTGFTGTSGNSMYSTRRLWGSYKLLDLVLLEVAYNSQDNGDNLWTSDTTGAFGDTLYGDNGRSNLASPVKKHYAAFSYSGPDIFNGDHNFTHVDHHNYLLTDVQLTGFSFGIMVPRIFADQRVPGDRAPAMKVNDARATSQADGYEGYTGWPKAISGRTGLEFVEDVLKQSVVGLKFSMSPIEIAAEFKLQDYGVYFGGKWFAGPVTVGLSMMGIFPTEATAQKVKAGASVNYSAGAFGAGIKGWYGIDGKTVEGEGGKTQIGIEPNFFYNIIPTHLRFRADVGIYFNADYAAAKKSTVIWALQPQIFWNFKGTGAGEYYGMNTGMLFRYRVARDATNALDATFRWAF